MTLYFSIGVWTSLAMVLQTGTRIDTAAFSVSGPCLNVISI